MCSPATVAAAVSLSRQLRGKAYAGFLADLREYLGGFLTRTQPLVDLNEVWYGIVVLSYIGFTTIILLFVQ